MGYQLRLIQPQLQVDSANQRHPFTASESSSAEKFK